MVVVLNGYLEVPPERIDAVIAALPAHIDLTRAEPGCLAFSVEQSADEPTHFVVAERFIDQAAFDAHQARAGASAWAEVTAGMKRHYRIDIEAD